MKRIFLWLVFFGLPFAAFADGMVIPTAAYPAQVTIPDQRALICFSNGVERLVIETRFTGAGSNFAWVVPLPSQPVIEQATTGVFPTLQYLFRPEIVHHAPRYFGGILAVFSLGYLVCFVRPTGRLKWQDALACVGLGVAAGTASRYDFDVVAFFFGVAVSFGDVLLVRLARLSAAGVFTITFCAVCLQPLFLPFLSASKSISASSSESVSVLDRRMLDDFETATIRSRDENALQAWLSENGFATPTNAGPIIAGYVKQDWVFVATKLRRASAGSETSTPHPLSFTFKTARPVYPMQLTGLSGQPLRVDLYFFANESATVPHFSLESRLRLNVAHPLLRDWTAGLPVGTKFTARLSPANMRQDVWLEPAPIAEEHRHRIYSRQGAFIMALNWTVGLFAAGLLLIYAPVFALKKNEAPVPQLISALTAASLVLGGLVFVALPKTEVRLVRGWRHSEVQSQQLTVRFTFADSDWRTATQARADLRELFSIPAKDTPYNLNDWDNFLVGGKFREEDSPGNYLLRETNHQLQLIFFDAEGKPQIAETKERP